MLQAMGLMPEVQRAIEEMGYFLPTEVQDESIPLILGGGDVMVAAPTGSGKTAAFALPIIELVHEKLSEKAPASLEDDSRACLSLSDRDSCASISSAGLSFEAVGERWAGVRFTVGASGSGRHEFQVRITSASGVARVGWSAAGASLDLGTDSRGAGYGGTAKKSTNRKFEDYGKPFGAGDLVRSVLDLSSRTIEYWVNDEPQGVAFRAGDVDSRSFWDQALFPTLSARRASCTLVKHPTMGPRLPMQSQRKTKAWAAGGRGCSAVVLEPARDLAEQTHDCFEQYARYVPDIKCCLLIGGCDTRSAENACRNGGCDVVTGTPRKVLDCVKRDILDVSSARFLVLDEADRFASDPEDQQAVLDIFKRMPKGTSRQTRLQVAFFSATLHSPQVAQLASRLCDQPTWVDLKGEKHIPESVHHIVVPVDPEDPSVVAIATKLSGAKPTTDAVHRGGRLDDENGAIDQDDASRYSERIKLAKPAILINLLDKLQMDQALVFCRTNLDCDLLERYLVAASGLGAGRFSGRASEKGKENAYSCCVLAGGRPMHERRAALAAFKSGDVRVMICTDVAARGIDVTGLPFVVNLTMPDSEETYVHRVGRVGRADRIGLAISIAATCKEKVWYCQKNKKPPQRDTRLYDQGGNCIWIEESEVINAVEKRLQGKAKIHRIPPSNMKLPEDLALSDFGNSVDKVDAPSSKHVLTIVKDVDQLKRLETEAQRAFFALRSLYHPTELMDAT